VSATSLAAAEKELASASAESAAAAEKAKAEITSLEASVARLRKAEAVQRKHSIQVASRMVTVWRQKEIRSVFRAWFHVAIVGATGSSGGFGLGLDSPSGTVMEGMAAADLHAKEEEMTQQIQGLTYRRRYIALRPVFREIFNKFDKDVRKRKKPALQTRPGALDFIALLASVHKLCSSRGSDSTVRPKINC